VSPLRQNAAGRTKRKNLDMDSHGRKKSSENPFNLNLYGIQCGVSSEVIVLGNRT
jgi:hypothetical protein